MTISVHQILPSPAVPGGGTLNIYVCIKKIGVCVCGRGVYFLISVAEIRYRHDLVRLCHKFHFCLFQMKIPHIDEEKELCCVSYPGLCLGFFVLGFGGGSRSQKFLEPRNGEKKFFRARRGPGACSPENFEKIVFKIG